MALVDTLEEQALLERILDDSKPSIPPECRHLHYLLFTPFRYGALYPRGSRFRRPGLTPGVFYASQTVEDRGGRTGVSTPVVFRRIAVHAVARQRRRIHRRSPLRFYADAKASTSRGRRSIGTPRSGRIPLTMRLATTSPMRRARRECRCCAISRRARPGLNIALLACAAFASTAPLERQVWRVHLGRDGRAGDLRVSRASPCVRSAGVRARSADRGAQLGSSGDQGLDELPGAVGDQRAPRRRAAAHRLDAAFPCSPRAYTPCRMLASLNIENAR